MKSRSFLILFIVFLLLVVSPFVVKAADATSGADQPTSPPPAQQAPASPPKDEKPKTPPHPIQKECLDFDNAAERIILKIPSSGTWKAIGQNMSAMRREVLEEIYRLIGLTLPEGKRVQVGFQSGNKGIWGFTQVRSWGAVISVQLSSPQSFLHGERPLFQHEMTHALQNAWLENYLDHYFPNWIVEGLATYVGGHGPHKLRKSVARSGSKMINGLGRHSFGSSSDYAEGYLAFLYLEHVAGEGAVKTFVRDITINRTPWKQSLKKMTNMEWGEFAENARLFSLDYIAQVGRPGMSHDKLKTEDLPPPQVAQIQDAPKSAATARQTDSDLVASHLTWRNVGLVLHTADAKLILDMKIPAKDALLVVGVDDASASVTAGIEVGDIVMLINGTSVGDADALQPLLDNATTGTKFKLEIFRSGEKLPVQLVIDKPR